MRTKYFILIFFFVSVARGQQTISLEAAMQMALERNYEIKKQSVYETYLLAMSKTGFQLPNTLISGQFKQINSAYSDNLVAVQQTLSLPGTYQAQKRRLQSEYDEGRFQGKLKERDLKKQVCSHYNNLIYIIEQEKLLNHFDSLQLAYLNRCEERFSNGSSNILEKSLAQVKRGESLNQLRQLKQDKLIIQLQFALVLNTDTLYIPESENKLNTSFVISDSVDLTQHSILKSSQAAVSTSQWVLKQERNKLLPDLFLGFSSMTMKGMGADNVFYNYNSRFNSFQLGAYVPLFAGAQKKRIDAAGQKYQLAKLEYLSLEKSVSNDYRMKQIQYQRNIESVSYYERQALPNADMILTAADQQLALGEIDFIGWFTLFSQYVDIKQGYLESKRMLHQSIIELNYYNN